MDRVVSYDYPIDNKEEMKMEQVRVKDTHFDEAEIGTYTDREGVTVVTLDFDPDYNQDECVSMMQYTPDQARQLAAYLMEAANLADKGI